MGQLDPLEREVLRRYKATQRFCCVDCGYAGLAGVKSVTYPWFATLPFLVSLNVMELLVVGIAAAARLIGNPAPPILGLIYTGIVVLCIPWRDRWRKSRVWCPGCEKTYLLRTEEFS